jgi:hypothetical protein
VAHSVNNHVIVPLDLKQHPVISDPQPVFRGEGREAFYIPREPVLQFFQCIDNPRGVEFADPAQILRRSLLARGFSSTSYRIM